MLSTLCLLEGAEGESFAFLVFSCLLGTGARGEAQFLLKAKLLFQLLPPKCDLLICLLPVKICPNSHLLLFVRLVKLQIHLSERVLFLQPECLLSLLQLRRCQKPLPCHFSKLIVLHLKLSFDTGLLYEARIHVLLHE